MRNLCSLPQKIFRRIAFAVDNSPFRLKKRCRFSDLYKKKIDKYSGETVLIWGMGGMPLLIEMESVLGAAFILRGARVHGIICDGKLKACIQRDEDQDLFSPTRDKDSCRKCTKSCAIVFEQFGIPYSYISAFVSRKMIKYFEEVSGTMTNESLDTLQHRGVFLGKNIRSALCRYFKGGDCFSNEILRQYTFSALITAEGMFQTIKKLKPKKIIMSHVFYVDYGPAVQIALSFNIPIISYMSGYFESTFYFKTIVDDRILNVSDMSDSAWSKYKDQSLTLDQEQRLNFFLEERYEKRNCSDVKDFGLLDDSCQTDIIKKKYGVTTDRPVWVILCHLNWDAVSDGVIMLHQSFNEWVIDTVQQVIKNPGVQWLVKIHPTEIKDKQKKGIQYFLSKNFPILPHHVKIMQPNDDINPLTFFKMVDGGVTVCGTSGLELALLGKPVILSGNAHYGKKGFTYDTESKTAYYSLLRQTKDITGLSAQQQALARRYAYYYFVSRQVCLSVMRDQKTHSIKFQWDKMNRLVPGNDAIIDLMCEKSFTGDDFILPESLLR